MSRSNMSKAYKKILSILLSLVVLGGVSSNVEAAYLSNSPNDYKVSDKKGNNELEEYLENCFRTIKINGENKEVYCYNNTAVVREKLMEEEEYLLYISPYQKAPFIVSTLDEETGTYNTQWYDFKTKAALLRELKNGSVMAHIGNTMYKLYIDDSLIVVDDKVYTEEEWLYYMDDSQKLEYILNRYEMSQYEFNVLLSVVYHEAAQNYDDAYRVANTIYNRTISRSWSNYISRSLYDQATASGQFVVYSPGYSGYDTETTYGTDTYYALLDCLTYRIRTHNYVSFKSNSTDIDGCRFTSSGNVYHNVMDDPIDGYDLSYSEDLYYTYLTRDVIQDYYKEMNNISENKTVEKSNMNTLQKRLIMDNKK